MPSLREFPISRTGTRLALLIPLSAGLIAQNPAPAGASAPDSPMRVTHVFGFEDVANNANGDLSVGKDGVRFAKLQGPSARINIDSIQDVVVGVQDRQVGGVPLTLGRAATPYGGGRVIALFSHKKFDTVTLEYRDANGGLHAAVFQLKKGQGDVLRDALVADGAQVKQRSAELKHEDK